MQLTPNNLFAFCLFLGLGYIIVMPICLLIIRFLTPQNLLDRYFKEPHFLFWETVAFTAFPGSFTRTIIFLTICAFPNMGRKRKMTDIRNYAPKWYITVSKWMLFFIVGIFLFDMLLLIGLGIEAYIRTS
jgi:hypothetical protein